MTPSSKMTDAIAPYGCVEPTTGDSRHDILLKKILNKSPSYWEYCVEQKGYDNYGGGRRFPTQPSSAEGEYTAVKRALAVNRAASRRFLGKSPYVGNEPKYRSFDDLIESVSKRSIKRWIPMFQKISNLLLEAAKKQNKFKGTNTRLDNSLSVDELLQQTILYLKETLNEATRVKVRNCDCKDQDGSNHPNLRFYTDEFDLDGAKDEPTHRIHLGEERVRSEESGLKSINVIKRVLSKVNAGVRAKATKSAARKSDATKSRKSLPLTKEQGAKSTDGTKDASSKTTSTTSTPSAEIPSNRMGDSAVPEWRLEAGEDSTRSNHQEPGKPSSDPEKGTEETIGAIRLVNRAFPDSDDGGKSG